MGRRKQHHRHLPKGMTFEDGTHWTRGPDRKRINLGPDLGSAVTLFARLRGAAPTCRTLHDVIDRYRLEILPLKRSENTREDQARQLTRLDAVFGHFLPDNLTAPMLYQYMDRRRTKDGKPAPVAARHEITLLGHVLSKSIRWGAGIANVVRTLERMPKTKRTRYVTDAEFAACRELANPRMRLAMDLARNIGQRRGDLLTLRMDQVSDDGIVIRQGKTGAGVFIEMTPELKATIDACKRMAPQIPRDYVLRTRGGGPYSAWGFSAIWQRLMKKFVASGGVRFTFHDLRAKAASDMPTIEAAQALLGHTSAETTKRVYKRNVTRARPVK
jgi:integrase